MTVAGRNDLRAARIVHDELQFRPNYVTTSYTASVRTAITFPSQFSAWTPAIPNLTIIYRAISLWFLCRLSAPVLNFVRPATHA
jgi:hypothetical protein